MDTWRNHTSCMWPGLGIEVDNSCVWQNIFDWDSHQSQHLLFSYFQRNLRVILDKNIFSFLTSTIVDRLKISWDFLFLIICAGCCNIYYNLCFMFLHRYIFNVNVICWGWENHFVRALFNEGTFLRPNIGYIKCLLFYYWQHIFSSIFFFFRL